MSSKVDRLGLRRRGFLLGVAALLVAALTGSCAGGGGGISGTGFSAKTVVAGTVTGFGSVVIGGVHYKANPGATVQVEGKASATETDLQPGMMVVLTGPSDGTGTTGSYDSISYRPDLSGPAAGVDPIAGTLTVFGQPVLVDAGTVFDGLLDLTALPGGALVQVSGASDSQGRLHASRLLLVKTTVTAADTVRFKGTVAGAAAGSFSIGGQQVSFNGATVFVGLSAADLGGTDPRLVEVTGTLSGATVSAVRIERLDPVAGAVSGDRVDIRGFIASGSAASFTLNSPNGPLQVSGASATVKDGVPGSLVPGRQVEVRGSLSGGALIASVIELEQENSIKLEGDLASIDRTAGSVVVNGIGVFVTDQTVFHDGSSTALRNFGFSDLAVGDHLQIGGFLDSASTPARVVATRLERENPSTTVIIQGPVSQLSPQVVILGVPIVTSAQTEFRMNGLQLASFADFSAQVSLNSTIVKAKGTFTPAPAQLVARELEIKP